MKVETHKDPTVFTPIRLIIDLESQSELDTLCKALKKRINQLVANKIIDDQADDLEFIYNKLKKC